MRGAAQGRVSSITRVVTCQGVPERVDFMTSGFFLPSLHFAQELLETFHFSHAMLSTKQFELTKMHC